MLCRLAVLICSLMLATAPVAAATANHPSDEAIGIAEKVVGQVYGRDILSRLRSNENIYRNERIRAGADGAADLKFLDQSRLTVGPHSEIVLDEFVYNPEAKVNQGTINLVRGVMRFTSAALDNGVSFKTPSAVIGIRGTMIDIMVRGQTTEVVVHEGRVQVTGQHGSASVGAGESLTVTQRGPQPAKAGSPEIQHAVWMMLTLAGAPPQKNNPIQTAARPQNALPDSSVSTNARQPATKASAQQTAEKVSAQPPAASKGKVPSKQAATEPNADQALQTAAIRGKDPQNLLYMDLAYGRVIIEMRSDLAPQHIARIKELVRSKFYDGLKFHSVLPGRFAMTGDPTGTGRGGSGENLNGEFSAETFRRGSVGMAHDRGKPNSADSQFFISLEEFSEINGKYTLWGQVIHGMDFIDKLRTGNPPTKPDIVLRMWVGADVTG